jgi:thiopeptide-type bacteriocin biosynthesis protein
MNRYGGPDGIELSENVFHEDSEAVVQLLEWIGGAESADLRWRLALKGLDLLLEDAGFDLEMKYALATRIADGFAREFRAEGELKRLVLSKQRERRREIEELLRSDGDDRAGRLSVSLADIAGSLMHMHANRVLRSVPRAQEMLIYRFLDRAYDSALARAGKKVRDRVALPV